MYSVISNQCVVYCTGELKNKAKLKKKNRTQNAHNFLFFWLNVDNNSKMSLNFYKKKKNYSRLVYIVSVVITATCFYYYVSLTVFLIVDCLASIQLFDVTLVYLLVSCVWYGLFILLF